MEKYIFLLVSGILAVLNAGAQCVCTVSVNSGTIVTVKNVSELTTALNQANLNNGNYTILLKNGTYNLTTNLPYINPTTRKLTIRSVSGKRDSVIIKGPGMNGSVSHVFNFASSLFTVADLTMGWVANHALQVHGEANADSCLIQNVRFVDINEQMIKVSTNYGILYSDFGIVECCLFEFTAGIGNQFYTGGIDGHHCKNWIVRNNTFKHIRSPDASLAEHAVHFWSESQGTIVENNLVINCDRGVGFGLGNDNTRKHMGGIIRNNMIHTSRDAGISLEKSSNTRVYNNTLHTTNYSNSIEYRFDSTYNAHIANNLTNQNITARDGGTATLENNYKYPDTSVFVNAAVYNYHLKATNANIIDKGKTLSAVVNDYDCQLRPAGSNYDIGADEYTTVASFLYETTRNAAAIYAYPNPAGKSVMVQSDHEILSVVVYNSIGEIVLVTKKTGKPCIIDTSHLPAGIFIFSIYTSAEITRLKICIQH